ncbi:MAG: 4Fe-4S binding protein [Spirochaetales bacterium]|nr:4Fe-4S binding protein [Spirochaetales bacterium]
MHKIDPDACQMCGACEPACPVEAIYIPEGKSYFAIKDTCTDCGACEAECGFNAIISE